MRSKWIQILLAFVALLCVMFLQFRSGDRQSLISESRLPERFLVVLGIAQDAGYPQAGCTKACCNRFWEGKEEKKLITSLALVDRNTHQYWLFEATPDMTTQLKKLQSYLEPDNDYSPDGIFLTHAHTGHYTGLMQFGRETIGASNIPVHVLPRMDSFLRNNGPWSQLVNLKNIIPVPLKADSTISLNNTLTVTPFLVPHRDEFSETAGYTIQAASKKILFIPDINKWEHWSTSILDAVKNADLVFIDGTFFQANELPGRDMSEIPHPFVEESLKKMDALSAAERSKIVFIHFNHTNPLLRKKSPEKRNLTEKGYQVAEEGMIIEL